MRRIHTRTYTNLMLTAVAVLLGVLALAPRLPPPAATAQLTGTLSASDNSEQSRKIAQLNPNADNATAQMEIAKANREIADALRKQAEAQKEMARSLAGIADALKSQAK